MRYIHKMTEKLEKEKEIKLDPCRNCKSEVELKTRRCPYCGILNPTVKLPEILKTIFGVLVVMALFTYFTNN